MKASRVKETNDSTSPEKVRAWIYCLGFWLFLFTAASSDRIDYLPESKTAFVLEVVALTLPYSFGFIMAYARRNQRAFWAAFAAGWFIPCYLFELRVFEIKPFVGYSGPLNFLAVIGIHFTGVGLAVYSLRRVQHVARAIAAAVVYSAVPLFLVIMVSVNGPEGDPVAMLLGLDKCAQEYARVQSPVRSYPSEMRDFGSARIGCLPDQVANKGSSGSYHYSYEVTSRGAGGEVTGYSARAHWQSFWRQTSIDLFTDESGIFRLASHGLASAGMPIGPDTFPVLYLNGCVGRAYDGVPSNPPLTLEQVKQECFLFGNPYNHTKWSNDNTFDHGEYRLQILMLEDRSGVCGFRVSIRPRQWGVTAIRSYLIDVYERPSDQFPQSACGKTLPCIITHATADDREATLDDPIVSSQLAVSP